MVTRKYTPIYAVAALVCVGAFAGAAWADDGYFGVIGSSDPKKAPAAESKPAPSYSGLIAPTPEEQRAQQRTTPEAGQPSSLETYAEYEAALEKQQEAAQKAEQQQLKEQAVTAPQWTPDTQGTAADILSGSIGTLSGTDIKAYTPPPISEDAKTVLSKTGTPTIEGMSPLQFGMSRQVEAIISEASKAGLTREQREAVRAEARAKLSNLANGLRVRSAVSGNVYKEMNLPENMIKDKTEDNQRALEVVTRALKQLDSKK